jgi:hypothetical protein
MPIYAVRPSGPVAFWPGYMVWVLSPTVTYSVNVLPVDGDELEVDVACRIPRGSAMIGATLLLSSGVPSLMGIGRAIWRALSDEQTPESSRRLAAQPRSAR